MRLRDETPLTPEAAAEMAALEAALAGEPVAPEHADLAALALALRDERPRFAAGAADELDARAAAGFPRAPARERFAARVARGRAALAGSAGGDEPGEGAGRPRRAQAPRRWLPAAGVAASIVVATTLALSLTGEDRGGGSGDGALIGATQPGTATVAPETPTITPGADPSAVGAGSALDDSATAGPEASARPSPGAAQSAPGSPTDSAGKGAPQAAAESAPSSGSADELERLRQAAPSTPSSQANRSVERGANLRLATTPRRLDDVASRVVRVTDGVGGFVRSSAVDSRPGLGGGATFELQIPVRRLQTALARLSELASVRSRNESSLDVTEQVAQARDRVAGLKAARRSLLRQIERATTPDQLSELRARLRSVEARLDGAVSTRAQLRQRTSYSGVLVEIVTEQPRGEAAGPWTPRDALGDAGRVLEVAAGVALIALAVLLPLALLAALVWPIARAAQRRRREGALDAPPAGAAS